MRKRVFRYFFDFLDGQTEWLNQMASQGWRLIKCGQVSYEFENCEPGEYEYTVEFVADKAYSESKDYKTFLESMGYKTFYKNLNVGVAVGKVQWRPWAEGKGQIVTAPGGYFKELLIVEKKRDGKPFELHTDLTDKLSFYRIVQRSCVWGVGGMFALVIMCISFAVVNLMYESYFGAVGCTLPAILCAAFGLFWAKPLRRVSEKIRTWEEEAKTNEYVSPKKRKWVFEITAAICMAAIIAVSVFLLAGGGGITVSSGSVLMFTGNSGTTHWEASYQKLNGFRQRSISLDEGRHTFTVQITTESGEVSLSITGKDGTEYYKGAELQDSTFEVYVDLKSKEKLTLRVDAKSHSGSYKLKWD